MAELKKKVTLKRKKEADTVIPESIKPGSRILPFAIIGGLGLLLVGGYFWYTSNSKLTEGGVVESPISDNEVVIKQNPDDSTSTSVGSKDVTIGSEAKSGSNDVKTDVAVSNETAVVGTNSKNGKSSNYLPYKNGEFYNIYQFPFGDANCTSSNVELDNLVNALRKNPELKISVIAYTDNVGDANVNQELSVKRAKAIFNYIVSKGIIAERLSYEGKGISTKYATQGENRRAEFIVRG
jgi:outer membrane protein OmpA-like peptidoglycan-associated protein